MKFLHPQFLWALFALAIPLVIHLFNFRRYKTLYFSDTRFLQNVVKQSKNINRLRHWLILISRMLALAALVLAFAFPYIPGKNTEDEPSGHAVIYIDNSPSMMSGPQQSSPLAKSRAQAAEIIKSLPQRYRIQVLTNNFSGRQQRFYSKTEALDLVDATKVSYAFRHSAEVIQRVKDALSAEESELADIFLLSDFQKSAWDSLPPLDENWRISLLPVQLFGESQNLGIDSLWFNQPVLQPGFSQDLHLRLASYGTGEPSINTIRLELNGETQAARDVELATQSNLKATFGIFPEKRADYQGKVQLEAAAPYFDNSFFFTFSVDDPIRVLLTGSDENESNFRKLFSDSTYRFEYSPISNINYDEIGDFNLVILDQPDKMPGGLMQQLQSNLAEGGNIVVIPSPEEASAANQLLLRLGVPPLKELKSDSRIEKITDEDEFFIEVFASSPKRTNLPPVKSYYQWEGSEVYPLLSLENNDIAVGRVAIAEGNLVIFTSSLSESNLIKHPILVPIMLNAALYSRQSQPLYTLAGSKTGLSYPAPENPDEVLTVSSPQLGEFIPPQRRKGQQVELYNLPADLPPGIYSVKNAEQEVGNLAVNVNPLESKWEFYEASEISNQWGLGTESVFTAEVSTLGFAIKQRFEGITLWKYFVAAGLLFLIIEIALIKLWK